MSPFAERAQAGDLSLRRVQTVRKYVLLGFGLASCAALPFIGSAWPDIIHSGIESLGLILIVMAIAGRAWCTLYIGGRKAKDLVVTGPYSLCRNPLYLFTCLGVFGIGLQTGAVIPGLVLSAAVGGIFATVVPREERVLTETFGADYTAYAARVSRYRPRFSNWRDSAMLQVRPATIMRTIADALPMLAAFPVMEMLEYLQDSGMIGAVYRLY